MRKDYYTKERLKEIGLNGRQIKAVIYVKEKGRITNREYQKLNFVSNKTTYLELSDIIKKDLFAVEGSGRTFTYTLKVMKK